MATPILTPTFHLDPSHHWPDSYHQKYSPPSFSYPPVTELIRAVYLSTICDISTQNSV